jgi:hypothetical protein
MVPKLFTRTTNNLTNFRVNYNWPAAFCAAAANWVLFGAMHSEHSCNNTAQWFKNKQLQITVQCINQEYYCTLLTV